MYQDISTPYAAIRIMQSNLIPTINQADQVELKLS